VDEWESISSIHYTISKRPSSKYDHNQYSLDASPISLGISAPHCCTFHIDCMLSNHSTTIIAIIALVNRGSRKTYERMRAAENWGRLGGIFAKNFVVRRSVPARSSGKCP
jgi:hypothetical protein